MNRIRIPKFIAKRILHANIASKLGLYGEMNAGDSFSNMRYYIRFNKKEK